MLGDKAFLSEEVESQTLLGTTHIRVGLLAFLCERKERKKWRNAYNDVLTSVLTIRLCLSLSHSLSKETHILTKLVEGVCLSIDDNHLVVSRWPLRVGNGLQLAPLF